MPRPLILDCTGPVLTEDERQLFTDLQPYGFILFKRHCQSPEQMRTLTQSLRDCVDHENVPILIDQEGGRVARMGPPHWRLPPTGKTFADLALKDLSRAGQAVAINAQIMAHDLQHVGVNVDCYPLLDLLRPETHDVIGDRAFGSDPDIVIALAKKACEGLMAGGVLPVIKHIPGHGRATSDSHEQLPTVTASREELESDFKPFRALRNIPLAMTAHILYTALDATTPATQSRTIIQDVIRGDIGYTGTILSDDLTMKALKGSLEDRAKASLAAGCNMLLLCNADFADRKQVLNALDLMSDKAYAACAHDFALAKTNLETDINTLTAELETLLHDS